MGDEQEPPDTLKTLFWVAARQPGTPIADDKALGGDVFITAQTVVRARAEDEGVIAITHVRHLSRWVEA
jgi:hypothetical protein